MSLSLRRSSGMALVLIALAIAAVVTVAAGQVRDDGPRNLAAERATGDTAAMLAVVQATVDCLRARGFHPGDPRVDGKNVVITDWNPPWDSEAGRATHECSFPDR